MVKEQMTASRVDDLVRMRHHNAVNQHPPPELTDRQNTNSQAGVRVYPDRSCQEKAVTLKAEKELHQAYDIPTAQ